MKSGEQTLYYAAWWRRFLAFAIDGCIVLGPVMFLQLRLAGRSPRLMAILLVPFCVLYSGYFVFCHGRWGRTLGKLLTGTRVAALDGSRISWRQAFLRESVNIAFVVPYCYAFIPAYLAVPLDEYLQAPLVDRLKLIKALWPGWYARVDLLENVWVWSEFVVILLNKRRRALHDFIAGTIVVQKRPTQRQARDEDPYNIDYTKEMKRLQKL